MKSMSVLWAQSEQLAVPLGDRVDAERDSGQVDALAARERPADVDPSDDVAPLGAGDDELELAVVDQDHIARRDVVGQTGVADAGARCIAHALACAEHERLSGEQQGVGDHLAEPKLGAGQVEQDGDRHAAADLGRTNGSEALSELAGAGV